MAEFFRFLVETNLTTAAFIIGAIAFVIAVIGQFKTIIEPSPAMRLVLALFGLFLMAVSVSGYFLGSRPTQGTNEISLQEPESNTPVFPTVAVTATMPQPDNEPTVVGPTVISSTAEPTPTMQPIPTFDPTCDTRFFVRESAGEGTGKTYIRCPVGEVEYSIQTDDLLTEIALECPDSGRQSISFAKNEQLSEGEELPTFDSARFTSYPGCKVYITIVNTIADQMGYTIREEVVRTQVSATSTPVVVPPSVAPTETTGPFREHKIASVGSGPLANVTYSDGMYPLSQQELNRSYPRVQYINPGTTQDGCGIALYDVEKIWFGSALVSTITVNGSVIGEVTVAAGPLGYIFDYPLRRGDKICMTAFSNEKGFHFAFGPDMYAHYDSHCYRGNC